MKLNEFRSEFLSDPATTACFSGHRPEKIPINLKSIFIENDFKDLIYEKICEAYDNGYRTFITGMARGFDTYAAYSVVRLRNSSPDKSDIVLIGVSPYRTEKQRLRPGDKFKYHNLEIFCDEMIYLNEEYTPSCYHERNHFMVDHSSLLISLCFEDRSGTSATINYAKRKGLRIESVDTSSLPIISNNDTSDEEKMQQQFF